MTTTALLIWLAASLPATSSSDPLSPYRGQPILRVSITGPTQETTAELRELIGISPGYLLNTDDVQRALKRLYALGRFSSVELYARRISGVLVLDFQVRPTQHLGAIEIWGTDLIDDDALRNALRLSPSDEVDSRTAGRIRHRALDYLKRCGLPRADVDVRRFASGEPDTASFSLTVKEGRPTRVRAVSFDGTPRVRADVLARVVHTKPGDVLNRHDLEADRRRIIDAYVARGFLRVRVDEPLVRGDELSKSVTFAVHAGDRISLAFAGSTILNEKELRALRPSDDGRLRRGDLSTLASRIERRYRRLGFPNAAVARRGFRDPVRGEVRYLFSIDVGQPVEVKDILFEGAIAIPPTLLEQQVRAVLLRELSYQGLVSRMQAWEPELSVGTASSRRLTSRVAPRVRPERRWVPELYEDAIEDIVAIYRGLGYLNVKVGPATIATTGRTATVRVPVREGPQAFIRSVSLQGNDAFLSAELLEVIRTATSGRENAAPIAPGAPLSPNGVEEGRIALIRHYRNAGFLYARVFAEMTLSHGGTWGRVAYRFEEGPQVRVQSILVRGNAFTRESLIRSRITFERGDLYRLDQAVRDQRAIADLGVFSSVRVKLIDEERPAEQKDLVAEVVERNRRSAGVAPGISTADGPRLRVSYKHLNVSGTASTFSGSLKVNRQLFFQLLGDYGETMRGRYRRNFEGVRGELAEAFEREAQLGIGSPPIESLPLAPKVRFDLINERDNKLAYSLHTGAAIVGVDVSLPGRFKLSVEPQLSLTELQCWTPSCDDDSRADRFRRFDKGSRWTFKLGPSITMDARDNPLNPTRGIFATVRGFYAYGGASASPVLRQGTNFEPFSFLKAETKLQGYIPIQGGVTLVLGAQAGTIKPLRDGSRAPLDERFYLGGRSGLRGFVEGALLPDDACVLVRHPKLNLPDGSPAHYGTRPVECAQRNLVSDQNDRITPPLPEGGNTFVLLKTELRLPLLTPELGFELFVDVGNLWVNAPDVADLERLRLRVGTGFGIRYATPVGALRIEAGFNPSQRKYYGTASEGDDRLLYEEDFYHVQFSVGEF